MSSETTASFMAMKEAGYYSKATTGAHDVTDQATPLVLNVVDALAFAASRGPCG